MQWRPAREENTNFSTPFVVFMDRAGVFTIFVYESSDSNGPRWHLLMYFNRYPTGHCISFPVFSASNLIKHNWAVHRFFKEGKTRPTIFLEQRRFPILRNSCARVIGWEILHSCTMYVLCCDTGNDCTSGVEDYLQHQLYNAPPLQSSYFEDAQLEKNNDNRM